MKKDEGKDCIYYKVLLIGFVFLLHALEFHSSHISALTVQVSSRFVLFCEWKTNE